MADTMEVESLEDGSRSPSPQPAQAQAIKEGAGAGGRLRSPPVERKDAAAASRTSAAGGGVPSHPQIVGCSSLYWNL